jgi:hypothetical protein
MLTELKDDLDTRWGTTTSYSPEVVRGDRNRQIDVPKLAFWASILDPQTKNKMKPKLSTIEWSQLWADVTAAIVDVGLESLDLSTNEKKRVREQSGNHGGNKKQCIGG